MADEPVTVAVAAPRETAGLDQQTRPADQVFTGHDALGRAGAAGLDWVWIQARGGTAAPDALERLLAAQRRTATFDIAVIAGAVVDADGQTIDATTLPALHATHPDTIALAGLGVLPIRSCSLENCLLRTASVVRWGVPDTGRYGALASAQWTAQILREHEGIVDPSSVVMAPQQADRTGLRAVPALARTLRSGSWTRGEQVALATQTFLRR